MLPIKREKEGQQVQLNESRVKEGKNQVLMDESAHNRKDEVIPSKDV